MKVSLTHCYTDKNKGDAAIIVATTQLIRSIDSSAKINMFSTFGERDEQFQNEQVFISRFSDCLLPGMFYSPRPVLLKKDWSRIFHFIWICLKFSLLLFTRAKFIQTLFFSKLERKGFEEFLDSDIIISKGGSYITAQNSSLRQSFSLIHMLYPFLLAKRYKVPIVIFSQSLGPVNGRFNQFLMKKALIGIEHIFLRESVCLDAYEEINSLKRSTDMSIIPDSAFYLKRDPDLGLHDLNFEKTDFHVGLTIVDHAFKYIDSVDEKQVRIKNYKDSLVETIEHLIKTHGSMVHIFPQVIVDNSHHGHNDVKISREIAQKFKEQGLGDKVVYHFGDYNPMQLSNMYSKMSIFIGTRLHSVIFSLTNNIPSINIAYHGTKSQGILKSIRGFEKYVIEIDSITPNHLIAKVDSLIADSPELKEVLSYENQRIKSELESAMVTVLKNTKNNNVSSKI